jgi:hypothetical protein
MRSTTWLQNHLEPGSAISLFLKENGRAAKTPLHGPPEMFKKDGGSNQNW